MGLFLGKRCDTELNVLEPRGLIPRGELLGEIQSLKDNEALLTEWNYRAEGQGAEE